MHFVGAVLVHESRWASVKAVLEEARCIALQKGYPAGEPLEFHGKEVYQGEGHWKKVAFGDRLSIYEKCISAFDVAKVGICYGACDKIKLQRYSKPEHPHNVALWLCLEQIAKYSKVLLGNNSSIAR